ncbi:SMP-30/gluconolactonase/LRE family protein [Microbacterium sp.]|uniref:SMP-30/gluconolactonase/LRE family protein n=1 Tax=Microbacterium sp. TaxID=51671 RepID=UPI003563DA7D
MTPSSAELLLPLTLDLGESPIWDAASASLLFVDVTSGTIHRRQGGEVERFAFGQPVGAALPTDDGGLVVCARDGVFLTAADGSAPVMLAAIEGEDPRNRMNDAKIDPAGRLWAGTMAFDFAPGAAALYRVDGRRVDVVLPGLTISNGMDWSPDMTLMYFIDSGTYRVDVMDFDAASGAVSDRRLFRALPESSGMPDGLTVDAEGGVWVAYFGAGVVRRFDAEGVWDHTVEVDAPQVTSCCFGGADLDELFITSGRYGMTDAEIAEHPLSGSVFSVRPGVRGRAAATPFRVAS